MTEINFDRVAAEYDATRGGEQRARDAARDLREHLPDGDLLEIGVGTGIVAQALLADGPHPSRLVGIDISTQMLRRAAERLPGCVVQASAQHLPFADHQFGAVVAVHVLHLVPDLTAALAEAARVLRPGGRVVAIHGQPEHDEGDELAATMRPLRAALPLRPDSADDVRAAGERVGLRCVAQVRSSPRTTTHSPADLADQITRRTWSFLWSLDDAQWRANAEPVIAALRALPDPHLARTQSGRTWTTALEKPA